jgi:glycosyltransferase involved in cell wall biosynthesis
MKKVYWFGYGGNSYLAEELRQTISELEMELVTIHEHENANVKWNRSTWIEELKKADIIILPTNTDQPAKSNNKLTQSLSLGKPVICSPLPAYSKIYEKYPASFLIVKDKTDWKKYLKQLRDDELLRKTLSENALKVVNNYSIDSIGQQWISLFNSLEKIDIIIPTYNNLPCLKL